eukprot:1139044-Pelagomonas_calceolata.AAC.12
MVCVIDAIRENFPATMLQLKLMSSCAAMCRQLKTLLCRGFGGKHGVSYRSKDLCICHAILML